MVLVVPFVPGLISKRLVLGLAPRVGVRLLPKDSAINDVSLNWP